MPDDPVPGSADSPDPAVPVVEVDGVRLAELAATLPLSRGSLFALLKGLGIVTVKGPGPEGRGRVAWLSAADARRLTDAAGRVARGELRIADVGAALQPVTPARPALPPPAASAQSPDRGEHHAALLTRLQATAAALATGAPLTTADVAALLGARPGSSPCTRAGITAVRVARNCWRLLPSAESADPA